MTVLGSHIYPKIYSISKIERLLSYIFFLLTLYHNLMFLCFLVTTYVCGRVIRVCSYFCFAHIDFRHWNLNTHGVKKLIVIICTHGIKFAGREWFLVASIHVEMHVFIRSHQYKQEWPLLWMQCPCAVVWLKHDHFKYDAWNTVTTLPVMRSKCDMYMHCGRN